MRNTTMGTRCLSRNQLFLVLSSLAILAGCSPLKYHYYFSHSPSGKRTLPNNGVSVVDIDTFRIQMPAYEVLAAGTSNNIDLLPKARNQNAVRDNGTKRHPEGYAERLILKTSDLIPAEEPIRDKKKNWAAIAGLAIVVIGIAGYAIPLWPLIPIGIVLSIIGLKSERRGLAKAGVVLGFAAIVAVLLFLLVNGFYKGITNP
jgi:hypothetical protein